MLFVGFIGVFLTTNAFAQDSRLMSEIYNGQKFDSFLLDDAQVEDLPVPTTETYVSVTLENLLGHFTLRLLKSNPNTPYLYAQLAAAKASNRSLQVFVRNMKFRNEIFHAIEKLSFK